MRINLQNGSESKPGRRMQAVSLMNLKNGNRMTGLKGFTGIGKGLLGVAHSKDPLLNLFFSGASVANFAGFEFNGIRKRNSPLLLIFKIRSIDSLAHPSGSLWQSFAAALRFCLKIRSFGFLTWRGRCLLDDLVKRLLLSFLGVSLLCSCTTVQNRRDLYSPQKVNGPYTRLLAERRGKPLTEAQPTVKLVEAKSSDSKVVKPDSRK